MQKIGASILVVEDDDSVRASLAQVFTMLGHSVRSAANGLAALVEIRREIPNILLSDLNMPVMSGYELLSIVRRRFPAIRVVAMSGAFPDGPIPYGVVADGYYQKGGGVAALLKVMGTLPLERPKAPAPIWIQRDGSGVPGGDFVIVACPDCFRTFPRAVNSAAGLMVDTSCDFCQSWIVYAIVEPFGLPVAPSFEATARFASPRVGSAQLDN
jgi:CheY-like chemotaxis protein